MRCRWPGMVVSCVPCNFQRRCRTNNNSGRHAIPSNGRHSHLRLVVITVITQFSSLFVRAAFLISHFLLSVVLSSDSLGVGICRALVAHTIVCSKPIQRIPHTHRYMCARNRTKNGQSNYSPSLHVHTHTQLAYSIFTTAKMQTRRKNGR